MKELFVRVKKLYLFHLIVIVLLSFLLSSCGVGVAETDITVYKDKYKLTTIISVSYDQMALIGGPEVFEEALNDAISEAENENVKIKWRDITERNSNTFRYEISSGMMEISASYADNFSWKETSYNNRDAYEFRYSQLAGILSGFQSHTITLHAGKILDSNGTQIDDRTVTWVNSFATPYAIVEPKGSASWVFIILSLLIVVATGIILYKLIKSGKLKEWATTGFDVGKWKIEETKLNSEIKSLKQDKEKLISELGEKTWKARVVNNAYAEPYEQLKSFDQEISELDKENKNLDSELKETRNTYAQLKTEYSERISQLKNEHKTADEKLNSYRKDQDNIEKQVSKLEKEKDKLKAEIQDYEKKLVDVQQSDDEDKEKKALSLSSAISTLNKNLLEITNQIPEIQENINKLQVEQKPIIDNIANINEQIAKTQADQKSSLEPLEAQIFELEGKIKEKKLAINDLQQKMKPIISTLGPFVNSARPESEALQSLYNSIDNKDGELVTKLADHNLVEARIDASDKSAIRNLLLTIAGIIIAIVLIAVFLSAAF